MSEKKKVKYIPVQPKVVEPKLYQMMLLVNDKYYLKSETAYSLEEALSKVTLIIGGVYHTPTTAAVFLWTTLSVDEIKNKFKHTK